MGIYLPTYTSLRIAPLPTYTDTQGQVSVCHSSLARVRTHPGENCQDTGLTTFFFVLNYFDHKWQKHHLKPNNLLAHVSKELRCGSTQGLSHSRFLPPCLSVLLRSDEIGHVQGGMAVDRPSLSVLHSLKALFSGRLPTCGVTCSSEFTSSQAKYN